MVRYLHFGRQCPGAALEDGARAAASILGRSFVSEDVRTKPELAWKYKMFFPGLIVVDELRLAFPGSSEQLAESIRTQAPLPGTQEYQQLPQADPEQVELLSPERLSDIRGLCIPLGLAAYACEKEQWLKSLGLPCLGLVGYMEGRPVAIVETLPRELIPYPIPEYRGLFITCMYGRHDADLDYRRGLLKAGLGLLRERGFARVGIVAGRGTPFPNGPVELMKQVGFRETMDLGRVILRHRWAEQVFMEIEI